MDHLKSSAERRDFWYSKDRLPKFVPVRPATNYDELLLSEQEGKDHDDNSNHSSSTYHLQEPYGVVRSIPYKWIKEKQQDDNNGLDRRSENRSIMQQLLRKHGFFVISGVLNENECDEAISSAWDWIIAATCAEQSCQEGMDPQQTDSIYKAMINKINNNQQQEENRVILNSPDFPLSAEGDLLPFYGSGHSSFAWMIRSNPKIKRIFETFYGTSDLISSLDGIVLWPKKLKRIDSGWFHIDQNPLEKPEFEAIQGIVNLLPVSPMVGGNTIVAQSNTIFPNHYLKQQYYKDRLQELEGDDWMEIIHNDHEAFENRQLLCCLLQPGDVLVWDSRTIHCSYPGSMITIDDYDGGDDNSIGDELIRAATLVSMMPAKRATRDVIEERRRAVDSGRTLTHWANKAITLGHERQEETSRESDLIRRMKSLSSSHKVLLEFDDLDEEQRKLVIGDGN